MAAMHACLQDTKILQNIVDHEEWGPYILNFALVCRGFYEPGMNARWRTLRSLEPLIMLLPHDRLDWHEEAGLVMLVGHVCRIKGTLF